MGEGGGCQWISHTHTPGAEVHCCGREVPMGKKKKSGGEKRCEGGRKEERKIFKNGWDGDKCQSRVRGVRGMSACVVLVLVLDERRN